jgi:processive 1,2-diacylglycerol beta-glucosyltransferase
MGNTDLVVLHSPVGGGHTSAARAVADAARALGLAVEVLDTFDFAPPLFGAAYLRAHLTGQAAFPALYGPLYFAANRRDGAFEPVRRGFDHLALAPLVARVCELAPRVVVATHHLPLVALGRARRNGWLAAQLIGVVTDYTSHAVWAEPGVDAFCVPTEDAARELAAHAVNRARIAVTGIPVRRAFHAIDDLREPPPGEPLRVLVTSGGFGVGPVRRIVRALGGARDVELTVICGAAPRLAARVERDAARARVRARVLGFERDMPSRVADAHVVVGKAGGLTVTEVLAAGRPMIVVGAVPGNEALNAAFVARGGAGIVAAPRDVARAVEALRRAGLARVGRRARACVAAWSADRVAAWALEWAARAAAGGPGFAGGRAA